MYSDLIAKKSTESYINRVLKKGSPTLYTVGVCSLSMHTRTHTLPHIHTAQLHTRVVDWLAPWLWCFYFFPPVRSMTPQPPPSHPHPVTVAFQSEPSPPVYLQNTQPPGREKKQKKKTREHRFMIWISNKTTTVEKTSKRGAFYQEIGNTGDGRQKWNLNNIGGVLNFWIKKSVDAGLRIQCKILDRFQKPVLEKEGGFCCSWRDSPCCRYPDVCPPSRATQPPAARQSQTARKAQQVNASRQSRTLLFG